MNIHTVAEETVREGEAMSKRMVVVETVKVEEVRNRRMVVVAKVAAVVVMNRRTAGVGMVEAEEVMSRRMEEAAMVEVVEVMNRRKVVEVGMSKHMEAAEVGMMVLAEVEADSRAHNKLVEVEVEVICSVLSAMTYDEVVVVVMKNGGDAP